MLAIHAVLQRSSGVLEHFDVFEKSSVKLSAATDRSSCGARQHRRTRVLAGRAYFTLEVPWEQGVPSRAFLPGTNTAQTNSKA